MNLIRIALVLTALILAACGPHSSLRTGEEAVLSSDTFSFDKGAYPSDKDLFPEYHIVPGDLLDVLFQIRSWGGANKQFLIAVDHTISIKFVNLPELNEEQNVQPDGKISLPYVGEVYVVGKTVPQLTEDLKKLYSDVFREPELYVVIPEFSSQIKELKNDLHTSSRGLSRLVTVRPDGYATFPLLGDVFVAGRTVPQANHELDTKYEEVLPGLHCDLFLEKTTGSVVYVLGEVGSAGAYGIDRPISVVQAVTLAGGLTSGALLDNVIVFRRHEKTLGAKRINLNDVLSARDNGLFFYLRPDDIVFVPRNTISTMAELMQNISSITLFRGWSISFGGDISKTNNTLLD